MRQLVLKLPSPVAHGLGRTQDVLLAVSVHALDAIGCCGWRE
jgi:hypothetical protein